MAWYKTGTVTVPNNSTTVTGSGTAFLSGAAIGEAIRFLDGRIFEIANISSDTSLTLSTAYTGSDIVSQAYMVVPTQSYLRSLALSASNLIGDYATVRDGIGQGKFPDGTASVPGIRFASDDNTGIRHVSADTLALVANGVDQLYVTTDGAHASFTGPIGQVTPAVASFSSVSIVGSAGGVIKVGGEQNANFYTDASNTAVRANSSIGGVYIQNSVGTETYGLFSSTGLAVSGALQTTGGVTIYGGSHNLRLEGSNALVLGFDQGGGASISYNSNTGNVDINPRAGYTTVLNLGVTINGTTIIPAGQQIAFGSPTGTVAGIGQYYESTASKLHFYNLSGGSDVMTISPTEGIAINGSLTATGIVSTSRVFAGGSIFAVSTKGNTFMNGAALTSYKIAVLPASGGGTFDHLTVEGFGGGWTASDKQPFKITFGNRGGLTAYYELGSPPYVLFRAYTEADGSISIWLCFSTSFRCATCDIVNGVNCTVVANPIVGTPTGTLTWDSDTATPNVRYSNINTVFGGTTTSTGDALCGGNFLGTAAMNHVYNGSNGINGLLLDGTGSSVRVVTANVERSRFDSSGNLFVGTTGGACHTIAKNVATTYGVLNVSALASGSAFFYAGSVGGGTLR